nr:508_t:CDS:2 [Entrophospora candida]CAG8556818.1 5355_t:CDS:2 [Entrophospora candida]
MKPTNFFSLTLIFIFFIIFNNNSIVSAVEYEIEFSYTGETAPEFWDKLSEGSKICKTGKLQSPIDITSELLLAKKKETPKSDFQDALNVEFINNGNTVEVLPGKGNKTLPATIFSSDDGTKYQLDQFHFHTPSEHRVNGRHFDVEQHLVFSKVEGKNPNEIAVVAVFYNIGDEENAFLKPLVEKIPKKVDEKNEIEKVELSALVKDIDNISNAFNYGGSLTTPPCTETVEWYVNQKPLSLSIEQFTTMRNVIGFNSRFTQLRSDESVIKKRSFPRLRRFFRR